jgi:hypothetical protein
MGNNSSKLSSTKDKDNKTNHEDPKIALNSAPNTYTEDIPNLRDDLSPFACLEHTRTDNNNNNTSGVNDITEAGHGYVALTSSEPAASRTSITATVGADNEIVSHISSDYTVSPSPPDLVSLASDASRVDSIQGLARPPLKNLQQRGNLPFSSPATGVGRAALLAELARVKEQQNAALPTRQRTSISLGHPTGARTSENAPRLPSVRPRLRDKCRKKSRNQWNWIKAKIVCCTHLCQLFGMSSDLHIAASIVAPPSSSQSRVTRMQRRGEVQKPRVVAIGLQDAFVGVGNAEIGTDSAVALDREQQAIHASR